MWIDPALSSSRRWWVTVLSGWWTIRDSSIALRAVEVVQRDDDFDSDPVADRVADGLLEAPARRDFLEWRAHLPPFRLVLHAFAGKSLATRQSSGQKKGPP